MKWSIFFVFISVYASFVFSMKRTTENIEFMFAEVQSMSLDDNRSLFVANSFFRNKNIQQMEEEVSKYCFEHNIGIQDLNSLNEENILLLAHLIGQALEESHLVILALMKSHLAFGVLANQIVRDKVLAQQVFAQLIRSDQPYTLLVIRLFVACGIDLDYQDAMTLRTPLIIAAINNKAIIAKFLISQKPNLTLRDIHGCTAYDYAQHGNGAIKNAFPKPLNNANVKRKLEF